MTILAELHKWTKNKDRSLNSVDISVDIAGEHTINVRGDIQRVNAYYGFSIDYSSITHKVKIVFNQFTIEVRPENVISIRMSPNGGVLCILIDLDLNGLHEKIFEGYFEGPA